MATNGEMYLACRPNFNQCFLSWGFVTKPKFIQSHPKCCNCRGTSLLVTLERRPTLLKLHLRFGTHPEKQEKNLKHQVCVAFRSWDNWDRGEEDKF